MSACSNCPFKKSTALIGSPDWLRDVFDMHTRDKFFHHTCHKTDPKADGYMGAKKKTECGGHIIMMINEQQNTPGRGGVYNSISELVETYLKHWLGEKKFKSMQDQARLKHASH
jgi:hypothetical protein